MSSSTMRDKCGHCVASSLESSDDCLFHLELFRPARFLENDVRAFWLDFETSGLDAVVNSIVEIGVLSDGAIFQTVVCPLYLSRARRRTESLMRSLPKVLVSLRRSRKCVVTSRISWTWP